jgi:putative copper resistance protein D
MNMKLVYIASIWLHLTAMAVWLGGMVFLAAVVLPDLRRGGTGAVGDFLTRAAPRLRVVGWTCLLILGVTGWVQLGIRGMACNANAVIVCKIAIYVVIVAISLLHDFWLGPNASVAMRDDPDSPVTTRWRRLAMHMGRVTALLAIVAVALGVFISRGVQW